MVIYGKFLLRLGNSLGSATGASSGKGSQMKARYYSLFERLRGSRGKWQQVGHAAYKLATARQVYQSALLDACFNAAPIERSLRVVKGARYWHNTDSYGGTD